MSEIKVDTVAEKTSANGVTVDGLNIKDSKLVTANSVITSNITDDAVTYAKIQNVSATDRILGRDSSGAGVIEEITPANLRTMLNVADGATAGGGKIGQVVSVVKTDTFTSTSGSLTDITGMSAAITPSASSSKVLVTVVLNIGITATDRYASFQLVRGSTAIALGDASSSRTRGSFAHVRVDANGSANEVETKTITFLDSPSTTSATTYKMQGLVQTASSPSFTINRSGGDADAAHGFRVPSSITLMEVLA